MLAAQLYGPSCCMYILMMHGDEVQRTVLPVDMGDELGYLTFELRRVCQRGRRDLNKDDIADPLRVVLEQLFERAQLQSTVSRVR